MHGERPRLLNFESLVNVFLTFRDAQNMAVRGITHVDLCGIFSLHTCIHTIGRKAVRRGALLYLSVQWQKEDG